VSVDEVLTADELGRGPAREPDHVAENRALGLLIGELVRAPGELLQKLTEAALELCRADSAGIGILQGEGGREFFHWVAVAGPFAHELGGRTPRELSPCAAVIDRDAVLLLRGVAREPQGPRDRQPQMVETLLCPLRVGQAPIGAISLVCAQRRFDAEDARLLTSLSRLASAGYQLADSQRAAAEASAAKSRFLAVMSHELRTPLNTVIAYAELLETGVLGPRSEQQRQALARIRASASHLVGIIDEVLTLARTDAGIEKVHRERCDIAALTSDLCSTFEPLLEGGKVRMSVAGVDDPLPIHTDPGKVRQILTNLLGNAVKFTRRGKIRVRVEGAAAGWIEVHVSDTGPGIRSRDRELVFEPFTQVDSSDRDGTPGTGLGLAISRRYARLLGGDVTVRSTLGQGSTFVLRLPRDGGEAAEV
jgi:signal transduction histidine kinase